MLNKRRSKISQGYAMPYFLTTKSKGKSGETGRQISLKLALEALKIAKSANNNIKILLAGGINIERIRNEGRILNKVFDYVDVNSGVEDYPGIKNTDKMAEILDIKA